MWELEKMPHSQKRSKQKGAQISFESNLILKLLKLCFGPYFYFVKKGFVSIFVL
jgi:hypothetical protein